VAGLGFVPLGTALLLDVPDDLLVSVAVALVEGLIVRGRPSWSRPDGLTSARFVPPFYRLDDQCLCFVQGGES
jgi:hypothetical protein